LVIFFAFLLFALSFLVGCLVLATCLSLFPPLIWQYVSADGSEQIWQVCDGIMGATDGFIDGVKVDRLRLVGVIALLLCLRKNGKKLNIIRHVYKGQIVNAAEL
jgi:hypothetical protein